MSWKSVRKINPVTKRFEDSTNGLKQRRGDLDICKREFIQINEKKMATIEKQKQRIEELAGK